MSFIQIELNQERLSGGQRLRQKDLGHLLKELEHVLSLKKNVTISLAFVSPKKMREYNKSYRGKDALTDVLAFTFEEGVEMGEILLCYEQAKKQAQEKYHVVRHELFFLIAHGILHLFGYDHQTPKEKKHMMKQQTRVLASLGINPDWDSAL